MSKFPGFEVAIVNPTKAKKDKKMARRRRSTKGRNKDGTFKKGGTKRKRRRSNPAAAPPARRRRRRASTSSTAKTYRRRNPGGGEKSSLKSQGAWPFRGVNYMYALPMVGQKVLTALVIKKWGESGRLLSGAGNSSNFAGNSWPLRNYILSFVVGAVGAKLIATRMGKKYGEMWYLSNIADMGERIVWSELFNTTTWGKKYFGASPSSQMEALRQMNGYDPGQADAMAGQAGPGAIYSTPSGRMMLDNQRQWQPMQGPMGDALIQGDPNFDGFGDALIQGDPNFDGMGHAMVEGDVDARYLRSGSDDAYQSAWMAY